MTARTFPDERISKGVRKLREKEAREGKQIVLQKSAKEEDQQAGSSSGIRDGGLAQGNSYAMSDIQSVRRRLR